MSGQDFIIGFYGKLPSHGDFVSRRLPRSFIEPWDQWLQGGLAASREQLGGDWLNQFLVSPIWQFALTPGLCGGDAWAGVMMPSVDRVGRYFPLTLVAKVSGCSLNRLFEPDCGWFSQLSELALSSLDYDFDLQAFEDRLQNVVWRDWLSGEIGREANGFPSGSERLAFNFELDSDRDTPLAFGVLSERLNQRFLSRCSYWRSMATEDTKPSLLLCEGMPPFDAYVGFLNGQWPRRGWQFATSRLSSVTAGVDASAGTGAIVATSIPEVEAKPASTHEAIEARSPWLSYGLSVVGMRRKLNEDAILVRPEAGMWAVADGMGGHSAGDVASRALVDGLAKLSPVDDLEYYSEQVAACLHGVNRDLLHQAKSRGNGHIIGSTIVVLLISGRQFHYLWAGDSRLYRYRQGELQQLTSDHSLYNESISLGLNPLDGSLEQGRGNVITRAVGADQQLQLDCGEGEVAEGDLFILCSDGLDKELTGADIALFCKEASVAEITDKLVREAETRGGRDNISVVVVKVL